MSYYLRIEAVNLSNFVYDTNDLSTIRGGGLLLLDAIAAVRELLESALPKKNTTITQGASWGLFELPTDTASALCIKRQVVDKLNAQQDAAKQSNPFRHATFMVDILEIGKDYTEDRDKLLALNRWQQMQAPSLAVPQNAAAEVCVVDKVRPGSEEICIKKEKRTVSLAVAKRREYGIGQKHGEFYETRTHLRGLHFTNDLDELSNDPKQGNLDGKIAVIYIDGNKFGDVVRACKNAKEQSEFDQNLRDGQNGILKTLLEKANEPLKNALAWKNGNEIRLETLLWGGDEIIWVVPAWLGWETLALFFEQAEKHIKINAELLQRCHYPAKSLTHAAGLVFCHHNAPIHRITTLARSLADIAKQRRDTNMLVYQVLESFDHAGTDLGEYRQKRLGNLARHEDLLIEGGKLQEIVAHILALEANAFPRGKIQQILRALLDGDGKQAERLQEKLPESCQKPLEALKNLCGGNTHWLHLADLWDYIVTEDGKHA